MNVRKDEDGALWLKFGQEPTVIVGVNSKSYFQKAGITPLISRSFSAFREKRHAGFQKIKNLLRN